jgi:IclR family transcriptional regulator, pca regulon regulatory protein
LFALRTAQENLFASHRACQPLGADVPEDAGPHTEYVQSLDRGLAVIRAFSARTPRLSIADVARRTGLTRAAARRFLHTLCGLGYVGVSGGSYYLRPRVLELGYAYLSSVSVAEIAQEHLVALAEELHESCSASVLDGADIVYIARAQTNRIMTISLTVGTRLPGYPTSMGRVLLAALPDDRLDAFLAGARLQALTESTPSPIRSCCARNWRRYASRAGARSTRSWRSGCARSRYRCATRTAGWSRRSTPPRTPPGCRGRG